MPTRQAISRIAKEGRKYGVSLGIITQRPGELDQTILSQCSTLFAMRLANDRDQEIIRSAIPNSSISTTSFLSSIGNGEAIAFGEAIAVPMRMRFTRVADNLIPKANGLAERADDVTPDTVDLRNIVSRMRSISGPDISAFQQAYSTGSSRTGEDEIEPEVASVRHLSEETPRPVPLGPVSVDAYRSDMLPRPGEPAAGLAMPPQTSIDSKLAELRREYRRDDASRANPTQDTGASPRRDQASSMRDSLIRKPLGSLFSRD